MDKSELSEEEYEARKKEAVALQKKRQFSNKFVFLSSIFLIIETIFVIFLIMIPLFALFSHMNLNSTGILMLFEVVKMFGFIGGLLIGFVIFRKVVNFIVRKYHYEDRLTESVKSHLLKKSKKEKEMELRK